MCYICTHRGWKSTSEIVCAYIRCYLSLGFAARLWGSRVLQHDDSLALAWLCVLWAHSSAACEFALRPLPLGKRAASGGDLTILFRYKGCNILSCCCCLDGFCKLFVDSSDFLKNIIHKFGQFKWLIYMHGDPGIHWPRIIWLLHFQPCALVPYAVFIGSTYFPPSVHRRTLARFIYVPGAFKKISFLGKPWWDALSIPGVSFHLQPLENQKVWIMGVLGDVLVVVDVTFHPRPWEYTPLRKSWIPMQEYRKSINPYIRPEGQGDPRRNSISRSFYLREVEGLGPVFFL